MERLESIEAHIDALDVTLGNFIELQHGIESPMAIDIRNIVDAKVKQIERSVEKLHDFVENTVLEDGGPVQGRLEAIVWNMEVRFNELQKQLGLSGKDAQGTSVPLRTPGNSGEPANTENEDLEARLAQAEEERNKTQSLYEKAQAESEHWKLEFKHTQATREGVESHLKEQIEAEQKRSRALFETIQSLKGNIRVMCRIRPAPADTPKEELVDFGPREKSDFSSHWGKLRIPTERTTAVGNKETDVRSFEFERIFGPDDTNDDIFNEISDLTECALQGESVGIFAYGQTGSGKTYTLSHGASGGTSGTGIIPRTLELMFNTVDATSTKYKYSITLSVLEIYVDNLYDLLQAPVKGQKVETRMDQATSLPLDSFETAQGVIEAATNLRETSSTEANMTSSRSHLILVFRIGREDLENGLTHTGLLHLVDLAGSERPAAAGLEGTQLKEGVKINESLRSLNLAITALGSGATVAYDSSLTRVLRPCLSQGSKTLMFVMVSPFKTNLGATFQTLEKGQEATNAKLASASRGDRKKATTPAKATANGKLTTPGRPSPSRATTTPRVAPRGGATSRATSSRWSGPGRTSGPTQEHSVPMSRAAPPKRD
ncbi:P-loop containing nucleoside triphosphate hydrolase protein [Hypoxylon sp. NC1633]|nr:P-loop containing nucleoside triphosphate hydrolase protein [Hypoxylon sp. NC1633]